MNATKTTLALLIAATLTACASAPAPVTPNTSLEVEKTTQPMNRNEVITAVKECESAGLRAVIIMSKRRVAGVLTDTPVDVTCAPQWIKY